MLGMAFKIKTLLVEEEGGTDFHETVNIKLMSLESREVLDIQFRSTPNSDGVAWYQALIIYKEEST